MKYTHAAVSLALAAALLTAPVSASEGKVSLGQYEGVQVEKVTGIPEITDDSVDNNIHMILNGFAQKKEVDRPAEEGDAVNIDYQVSVGGRPIEGAGMLGFEITIGNTSLFPGFDTSLIGKKAGDTYSLKHAYSPNYAVEELAGNEALFRITVNSVKEVILPDLTDDFVQKVSTKSKTVDEYREEVRAVLEENNKDYIFNELRDIVWQKVLEDAEVTEWPEDQLKEEKEAFYAYYQSGADTYEMSFDDFLAKLQISKESFEKQAEASAHSNVKENLVAAAIAAETAIEFSEDEYAEAYKDLAVELGFDNVDDMLKEAPSETYLQNMVLRNAVIEWLVDHCEQVEEKEEASE